MSSTWVNIPAFVDNTIVTNKQVWDILSNMQYLKNRPEEDTITFSSPSEQDFTNTGATQDDLPSDTWAVTVDTRGGDVLVGSTLYCVNSVSGRVYVSLSVDGIGQYGKETYEVLAITNTVWRETRGVWFLVTGLAAGEHTFQMRYGVSTGTLTVAASRRAHIWALEIGE